MVWDMSDSDPPWYVLTPAEHPTSLLVSEMLGPSRLPIMIWSLSKSLRPLWLTISSAFNISTTCTEC